MALSRAKALRAALLLSLAVLPLLLRAQEAVPSAGNRGKETPQQALRRSLEEMEADIEAIKARTLPLLGELGELPAGYWGKDAESRFVRRDPLRAAIRANVDASYLIKREHDALMKKHEMLMLTDVLGSLDPTLKGVSEPLESGLVSYGRYRDYSRGLNNFYDRAGHALAAEGESFRAAQKSRRARRLWVIIGLAAAAAMTMVYLVVRLSDLPAKVVVVGGAPIRVFGGTYRLEEELSRDSVGVAYKSTQLREKDPCVVWIMHKEAALPEKEAAARARRAAGIRLPGLEAVREVLFEEGRVCLVLDPEEGDGLDRLLADAGRLPMGRVVDVLGEASKALDGIHAAGMVHGGVRPADIHLSTDGRVKVARFGVPRAEAPAFSAPEQMFAAARPASDLFALAVCAYQAVIGLLPFSGPDFPEQKRRMEFVLPSQALAGLPKGVDDIFRRALSPDPARRQSSCGEFAMALKSVWVRSRKRG